jgi:hypothetical protein
LLTLTSRAEARHTSLAWLCRGSGNMGRRSSEGQSDNGTPAARARWLCSISWAWNAWWRPSGVRPEAHGSTTDMWERAHCRSQ